MNPAQMTDLDQLCELVQNSFGPNPKTNEIWGKWIKDPSRHVTIARINERLLGVCASYINEKPDLSKYELFGESALNFLRNQKLGWFLTLAVAPEHRRSRIGWRLAKEHYVWLKAQGCTALVGSSWVTGSQDNSGHMFIKSGFQKLGESQEFLRNQLKGTGSKCSACLKTECVCTSVLFGQHLTNFSDG